MEVYKINKNKKLQKNFIKYFLIFLNCADASFFAGYSLIFSHKKSYKLLDRKKLFEKIKKEISANKKNFEIEPLEVSETKKIKSFYINKKNQLEYKKFFEFYESLKYNNNFNDFIRKNKKDIEKNKVKYYNLYYKYLKYKINLIDNKINQMKQKNNFVETSSGFINLNLINKLFNLKIAICKKINNMYNILKRFE